MYQRLSHSQLILVSVIALVVSAAFIVYFLAGHAASGTDTLVMPLDDSYIHFQYARMIAAGQPFRYQAGEPYTSGATSLLYPFVLAAGYALGFQGMNLSLWAVGIGLLSWIGSAWLVFLIVRNDQNQIAIPLIVALAFALTGSLAFAFMSGMETGLFVFLTLWTFYQTVRGDLRGMIVAATLATITRPEGVVIAVGACAYFAIIQKVSRRWWPLLTIPLLAAMIQPLINLALTGTITASGMQAKSYLYNVPFDLSVAIKNIVGTFGRAWLELLTGLDRDNVLYIVPILMIVGLIGCLAVRPIRARGLLLVFWISGLFAAASILETAFWQFKRYQQPVMALLFVALGWLLSRDWKQFSIVKMLALVVLCCVTAFQAITFAGYYADNVREVASVQIPMARYVQSISQPADRIAVHDIGVMAYVGERPVYDVVGLVTRGAAAAWRTGPGAVYEGMASSPQRPAYFAIYDEPHGLSYFRNTGLFADTLRVFESMKAPRIVASAASRQIVTKIDWRSASPMTEVPPKFSLVDSLNIGDLDDEKRHDYAWKSTDLSGYATEFFDQTSAIDTQSDTQKISDGGRLINSYEEFTITSGYEQQLLWVIRVHPRAVAKLILRVNGREIGVRHQIGDRGGQWIEIRTLITPYALSGYETRLRVDVERGLYMPFQHWIYQGYFDIEKQRTLDPLSAIFDNHVSLYGLRLTRNMTESMLRIDAEWWSDSFVTPPKGDAKVFVHLYPLGKTDQPPVTQYDNRPGNGTMPPANWLPGIFRDTYLVPLPKDPGTYEVAIGMYNPENGVRDSITLPSDANTSLRVDANRLFIGTITIP